MFDLKIKNAKIIDGTGLKSFHGDIAIIGNTIVDRGKDLAAPKSFPLSTIVLPIIAMSP